MAEQHVKIFESMGVPKDVIDKIEAITPEALKDFKADEYTGIINPIYENRFLNDAGFLGKIPADKLPATVTKNIETVQYERFLNEVKTVAKELDIDISKVDDMTQRQLKNFTRAVIQEYGKKTGASNETITKLQNDLQAITKQKSELETGLETKITEAVTKERSTLNGTLERMLTLTALTQIEGLVGSPEYITDTVLNKVKTKYTLVLDPVTLQIGVMQKEHPQLKALDKSGNQIMYKDALAETLQADKMIVEKKKEEEKKPNKISVVVGGEGEGETPVILAGGDKIKKAMEGEEKNKVQ